MSKQIKVKPETVIDVLCRNCLKRLDIKMLKDVERVACPDESVDRFVMIVEKCNCRVEGAN